MSAWVCVLLVFWYVKMQSESVIRNFVGTAFQVRHVNMERYVRQHSILPYSRKEQYDGRCVRVPAFLSSVNIF